jgi:hypothetical protein
VSAFGKSLWGHAVDKAVELVLGIGPFVAILVKNDFSIPKIIAERNESLAILVTSFSAFDGLSRLQGRARGIERNCRAYSANWF